jgi:hypothetical protein
VWTIESSVSGQVPVEITYFTSGLSWQAFYLATLSANEKQMDLKGYVRVSNQSGEDYENARTRLVVGKINLLEKISQLAKRQQPYGQPGQRPVPARRREMADKYRAAEKVLESAGAAPQAAKAITKEGLSEYFLYTIEGTETIKNGWSKRLRSFQKEDVDITNLYKFDQNRYGPGVVRFVKFHNDEAHNLGETPLPGGLVKVFGRAQNDDGLRYIGADNTKYIPVDQEVELNLGRASRVTVKPRVMDYRKLNIVDDSDGDVSGFDEVKDLSIRLNNYRKLPVQVEVTRHLPGAHWELDQTRNPGSYEKVDERTIRYLVPLEPHSETGIRYTLTLFRGERQYRR